MFHLHKINTDKLNKTFGDLTEDTFSSADDSPHPTLPLPASIGFVSNSEQYHNLDTIISQSMLFVERQLGKHPTKGFH